VRKAVRLAVVAVLAFVMVAMPSVARADGRVALVVGNSTYAHIGRLPNPDNDARDISAALVEGRHADARRGYRPVNRHADVGTASGSIARLRLAASIASHEDAVGR